MHPRNVLRELGVAGVRRLPSRETLLLHRDRERLVERRIVLDVDDLVRELVEDEPGDLRVASADERRQQRVVEVAERRVGRYAGNVDVVTLRREPRSLRPGIPL